MFIDRRNRLVGNDHIPGVEQGPRQRGALILAARQLAHAGKDFLFQPQRDQNLADFFNISACGQHEISEISPYRPLMQPAHVHIVKDCQRLHQRRILRHQGSFRT